MASTSDQVPSSASSERAAAPTGAETATSPSEPHHHHHHHHQSRPSNQLPPDAIDLMDESLPPSLLRHHSGPFDPVTKSAYLSQNKSPLAALEHSTAEILHATPEVSIRDSLNKHVPLQNTAVVGPGELVPGGLPDERLDYEEENLIGDIGRWQGVDYDDDDRRAKGHGGWEGAFMGQGRNEADRAKYEAKHAKKRAGVTGNGEWSQRLDADGYGSAAHGGMIEMVPPERDIRLDGMQASASAIEASEHNQHHGILDGIKRRISLKRHKDHPQ